MARRNLMPEFMAAEAAEAAAAAAADQSSSMVPFDMLCHERFVNTEPPALDALTQNTYAYAAGDAMAAPHYSPSASDQDAAELDQPFSDADDDPRREHYRHVHTRLLTLVNLMSTFTNTMQASIHQLQQLLQHDITI